MGPATQPQSVMVLGGQLQAPVLVALVSAVPTQDTVGGHPLITVLTSVVQIVTHPPVHSLCVLQALIFVR